ncbi:hypothetical protein SAMN05446037_10485 [Anaerovirgula multivorans]|uniref:Cyclic lactone autoinducer peptide n=1 Tax=Anaerovirgula multivorans TaxID=312168 RepID=A0A239KJG2_9FIRM|nr:hypothetical protein SAMN05446037_10485 [Anaerovirgula multivorans]
MKSKTAILKRIMGMLCSFLIFISPLFVYEITCVLFWGEPNCPNAFKQSPQPLRD